MPHFYITPFRFYTLTTMAVYKCNTVGNILHSLNPNLNAILYFCVVKFLTLLFAFYILLLPCIPCTDKEECTDVSKTQSIQSSGHQQHQHENEACTPFCTCACCGQTIVSSFNNNKPSIAKLLAQQKGQTHYNNISTPAHFLGNIWQPPKLV